MGVWLLGFGFLRRSTSSFHGVVCRLLISPWMAYMKKMQEQFSFFCLINHVIADATAIGFHRVRSLWSVDSKEPRRLYSGALPLNDRSLVKQISPDKNVNCCCTASSFTVSLEPVDFVTLCPLIPETQPYMTFLGFGILRRSTSCFHAVVFVSSQFCTRASFPHFLADLQLPSASSYHHLISR